jgi:2,4-diketo-3-deoxy-L-fuconate hydrolase
MRLVRFSRTDEVGWGLDVGEFVVDGRKAAKALDLVCYPEVKDLIEDGEAGLSVIRRIQQIAQDESKFRDGLSYPQGSCGFLPPLPNPNKLLCLAGNYHMHIKEAGLRASEHSGRMTPQVFMKAPSTTIIGPFDPILIQQHSVAVDWELELAVVVGRRGKYITPKRAMDYVFGYTIMNDVSERRMNSGFVDRFKREFDPFFDWLNGKWFDSFAPLGPAIVTSDDVDDAHHLSMRLTVNGELMQNSNTKYMIFNIPETIAYISSFMTLEPGDIIATGTPEGVGMSRNLFLKPGDKICGEIEQIGRIENMVKWEAIS